MTTLYNCKSEIDEHDLERYRITKFDGDMNVESSYSCTKTTCECPAGVRPSCRHRDMLPKFIARAAVNSFWMYDFDRGGWISSDVHLEGALAREEPSVSPDPGTQMPIAGERPRASSNVPLLRRF